ncbi:MAG: VWA-like domain-containing protein [Granulosicoccaceae bacterium]|jgi:predicted metal-dependent peptidase
MSDDTETKLAAARTRLILDKPFLGALVMRLPMKQARADWCKTTATDAKSFYYNKQYIDDLSLAQTQFVLAHEALHCALSHFARRQHRIKHRWDLACDLAINPILINDGLSPTPDTLYDSQFEGMTAEEIYPSIDDLDDRETEDQHVYDDEQASQNNNQKSQNDQQGGGGKSDRDEHGGGSGEEEKQDDQQGGGGQAELDDNAGGAMQPPPLSETEKDDLSVQWQQRLAGAAQLAQQAGKMGEAMARLVDHLLQPQLPWRMLLARYMTAIARDDYSFQRPSRREGAAILPSLRSNQVDVAVVLDTSGSISEAEISEFVSEVDAIKGQMRAKISLYACDDKLADDVPWVFEPWETFSVPDNLPGGGGTDFRPPFDYIRQTGREPDLLVYFTDAQGAFPEIEPNFPVIWLVKGREQTPWGQRIQLN